MDFIKLTDRSGRSAFVRPDDIRLICDQGEGITNIGVTLGAKGVDFEVEAPEETVVCRLGEALHRLRNLVDGGFHCRTVTLDLAARA